MKHINDLSNKEILAWYTCDFISDSDVNIQKAHVGHELRGDNVVFYPANGDENEFLVPIGHFAHALNNKPIGELKERELIPLSLILLWK